jgi:DNA-binding transcriptional regulator YdaS (Cro superfamily)
MQHRLEAMSTMLAPEKAALQRAAAVLGGQAAMAAILGYSDRRGVWAYFHTDRRFPAEHCPVIERATRERGQVVMCEELRPDVAWDVLREQSDQGAGAVDGAKVG